MGPARFSDKQIVLALRQVEDGAAAAAVCRNLGVTQSTFYRWRKKSDSVACGRLRDVRELRAENQKLKQILADLLASHPSPNVRQ